VGGAGPGFFSDGDMLHTCNFGKGKIGGGKRKLWQDPLTRNLLSYHDRLRLGDALGN
jgi:hypothetical protein